MFILQNVNINKNKTFSLQQRETLSQHNTDIFLSLANPI